MTRLHHAIGIVVLLASAHCGEPRTARIASPPGDPVIAFVGVTVLPLDSAKTLPDQTVVVRGEREAEALHARGTSLPGIEVALDHAIAADTLLGPDAVLSGVVLWRSRLQELAVGQSIKVSEQDIGLGSEVHGATLRLRRRARR